MELPIRIHRLKTGFIRFPKNRIADDYYEEIVDDLIDVSAGSYLEDLMETVSLRLREKRFG